jgi:hypothetical protein
MQPIVPQARAKPLNLFQKVNNSQRLKADSFEDSGEQPLYVCLGSLKKKIKSVHS